MHCILIEDAPFLDILNTQVLKYLPSDKAKDAKNFMMSLQYWLGGSSDNIENFLLMLSKEYVPSLSEADFQVRPLMVQARCMSFG